MNLEKLYELQAGFDATVKENVKATGYDTDSVYCYDHRLFAFHCELMELANEIRFFKFWKQDKKVDMAAVLEEGVDCVHFLLSIGLMKGYQRTVKTIQPFALWEDYSVESIFEELRRNNLDTVGRWQLAFEMLIGVLYKMGMNLDDIYNGYLRKNDINIQRQEEGY